jgi:PAS domain S-box-containing protein
MFEFLRKLFDSDFMSHGYCYLWRPEIVWLHAASDSLIALSYYFIPLMLVYLVRRRRDLPFHWMFLMFGVFILGCGTTHAMEIWTLWHGTYRFAGIIKAITAAASLATAVALVPMVPKALQLPSPAQLQAANLELEKEIAERRRVDEALQTERNFVAAVLNTVGTIIVVLDLDGKIVQFNSACEQISGARAGEVTGRHARHLFAVAEEGEHFQRTIAEFLHGHRIGGFESHWSTRNGDTRVISWSTTTLADASGRTAHIIAAGVDFTESKRLEKEVLDISAREQRRIGQDLHDGLGQHLTGIAFMSKVLSEKLAHNGRAEAEDAGHIVQLVNEAINKTRELSRGLLPVGSDALGLMSALEQWADDTESRFGITCRFHCDSRVFISDGNVATHTYRIAQEAVNNAIKHGHASRIDISLRRSSEHIVMQIQDNGVGLPEDLGNRRGKGLGLQIMNYRAKMIGGELRVERGSENGTIVTCEFKTDRELESDASA